VLAVLAIHTLWGGNPVAVKLGLEAFPPLWSGFGVLFAPFLIPGDRVGVARAAGLVSIGSMLLHMDTLLGS